MSPCSRQLKIKRLLGCSSDYLNEARLYFTRGAILVLSIAAKYIRVKAHCFHTIELGKSSV